MGATARRERHRAIRRSHLRQFHDRNADHNCLYRGHLAFYFFGVAGGGGSTLVMWGAMFLLICTLLNLAHVNVFKLVITLGVYAEMVGSLGVALLLFFFFRQHAFAELFQHLGTGTAPSATAAQTSLSCAKGTFPSHFRH